MAVRLRLRRIGKKKLPIYHIVAADSRVARTGKFLEILGRYEPLQQPMLITANEDRVFYWLRTGAKPTDTVRSLLKRTGLWMKWNMSRKGVDQATIATEMQKWQMAQVEKNQRHEARKARRLTARRKSKKSAEEDTAQAAPAPSEVPAES
ncbi:MAG: 30S ribosomal protein S16 [Ignavibacteria bacterium]|nr:30S ribosomal protein S16 [Ignavibacteria bacterium]